MNREMELERKLQITEQNLRNMQESYRRVCDKYEQLEKENKKLKKIIKENFGYNENTKECFFNYDGPVMEEEIKEVLKND